MANRIQDEMLGVIMLVFYILNKRTKFFSRHLKVKLCCICMLGWVPTENLALFIRKWLEDELDMLHLLTSCIL